MNRIQQISFIGYGNVATHLSRAFQKKGIEVTHIYGPESHSAIKLAAEVNASYCSKIEELPVGQLTFVCVPDDEIANVVEKLNTDTPIAYTSGFQDLSDLPKRSKIGVFYPLQTFSKTVELELSDVPIFIESENAGYQKELIELGEVISVNVHVADSDHRQKMHAVAVWVNNFTNHLIHHAQELARENNVSFEHLRPLLKETINKLDYVSAYEAQTGPARRNDLNTIEQQAAHLTGIKKELYDLISKSIIETYGP